MAARLKSETFSPVDATWFRMDKLTNKMMITGVMMFEEPLDFERVKEIVAAKMVRHDRYRQRVRETPLGLTLPRWEEDPHFDINAHLHRIALPAPGDVKMLQELVGDLMSTPLDYSRPLWDFHVVENYDHGGAVVGRMHHCIADGIALVDVLLGMTDEEPEPVSKPRARDLMARAPAQTKGSAISVRGLAGGLVRESWATLKRPSHAVELAEQGQDLAREWIKQGSDVVAATGKLLLTLPDSRTVFRGSCGRTKRAAWSDPFPLEDVKAIGKRLGGKVNDVLLAAVAGALRRYLEGVGQPTQGVEMNAMVPVNLRQPHEMGKLGNRFGLVILTLPVGTRDPIERLVIMKKRMDDIKNSPEALVAYVILNGIGLVPIVAEHLVEDFFVGKTSAVMTNVPGPREPLYMAGSRMNNMMFWVPVYGNTGMGISIMSYAGTVTVGIMTDTCTIPDPVTIAENFNVELRDMERWLLPAVTAVEEEERPAEEEEWDLAPEMITEEAVVATEIAEEAAIAEAIAEEAAENKAIEEAEDIKVVEAAVIAPGQDGKGSAERKAWKKRAAEGLEEGMTE